MQSETKQTKHVTNRQGVQLADMARANNVSRSDFAAFLADEAKVKKFFADMNTYNAALLEKLKASAEKIGARIHVLTLDMNYDRPHNEAALVGGPQTPSNYNVLKVGGNYAPSEKGVVKETIILFNWPKGGGSYQKAVEWGLENGLRKTTPHVPFAVGEHNPRLNYDLGPNPMYVCETTGCTFNGNANACYMWWNNAKRKSNLNWQNNFGNDNDWFAFRNSLYFSLNFLWIGGVLFCELSVPSAEHFANLIVYYGQ